MSGDFSRGFDPRRNYSAVLFQAGRILTDADFNEQSDIAARRFRAAIVDLMGRVFVAAPDAFKIACDAGGGLTIGRGRIYVDGLLAENHGAGQPVWDAVLDEERGAQAVAYTQQPYWPDAPPLPRAGGPYLVYLDVWQRRVTANEVPALGDNALDGVDSADRIQTVWQVKLADALPANDDGAAPPGPHHHYAKLALFTPPRRIRDLRQGMTQRRAGSSNRKKR